MKYWLFAVLAGCAATPAMAETCVLTAQPGASARVSYDPFAGAPTEAEVVIIVRNSGAEACQARIFLTPVDGSATLQLNQYRLNYEDRQFRGASPRGGQFGPYPISVPANGSETLRISLQIPAGQVVPPGTYLSELTTRALSSSASGDPSIIDGPNLSLQADVGARALVNIAGTTASSIHAGGMAPAKVDFGEIVQGATERVFVNVWANSSVSITLSSENGGELRRDGTDPISPIRYQTTFDKQVVSLSAPYRTQRIPPLSASGANYELAFTLLDPGRLAGIYRDTVTVTIDEN